MSTLIWKGPTNALVYQPNSPRLVYADRVKAVDIYKGPQNICAESMLARGTFGTGIRAGWVVNQCTCDNSRGNVGILTIEWEAGGAEATQPLPTGDFQLEPQEIYPKVERNPFFTNSAGPAGSGILPDVVSGVYNCIGASHGASSNSFQILGNSINGVTYFTNGGNTTYGGVNFSLYPNTNAVAQNAYAHELLNKLANGEESYYVAGYRYSFSSFSYAAPTLSEGGIICNANKGEPGGPVFDELPSGISWLRLADKIEPAGVNGSMFKLTQNYIGGPNGYWDPDLYTTG